MENEAKVIDQPETALQVQSNSPAAMMIAAMNSGMDLTKLEKFMELQERHEANEARKAYHAAMSDFKAQPPKIGKDKHVKFATAKGVTEYDHATLANVTDKISTELSKHGLSAAWRTEQAEKLIKVTCTVTHVLGHSESTSLSAYPDDSGGKNSIQAVGSTVSYLQRYTLLAITGLATHDMDDDGKGAEEEYITEKQVSQLTDMINETGTDEAKFLSFMAAESIAKIPAKQFNKAYAPLKAKLKKEKK